MSLSLDIGRVQVKIAMASETSEEHSKLTLRLLTLANEQRTTVDLVRAATTFFQELSGCEAIGVRLKEGDDYPYYETRGFSNEFLQLENSLCQRDPEGNIQRDGSGNPCIACMCGNVILGRTDPSKPFFTQGGSFWTNCTTELLATTTDANRQANTRNRCNGQGYESVALIPLIAGQQRLGLIQLNDRRKGLFSAETIAHWERLAAYLAVALAKSRAEQALMDNRERLNLALTSSRMATFDWDIVKNTRTWDSNVHSLLGTTPETFTGRPEEFFRVIHPDDRDAVQAALAKALDTSAYETEYRAVWPDGSIRHIAARGTVHRDDAGKPVRMAGICWDITKRKLAESNQRLMTEILRVLNRGSSDLHSLMNETLRMVKEFTGFDAVGLRLRSGDNCPYYEHNGFSEEFLREENFLCEKRGDGSIVRDAQGRAVLECTCGLVLSGRTDPSLPFFTEGGSFWTNVSTELLALTPEVDPRTNPRNRCIHLGYQSVALVPVRAGDDIIGLLQLNDHREGRFTPELIRFYEILAENIGLALQRKQTEDALRQNREDLDRAQAVAQIGSWRLDVPRNVLNWSDETYRIFGIPKDTPLTYETFLASIHPDDRQYVDAKWQAGMAGAPYDIEHRIVADGQVKWVREKAYLEFDDTGRLLGGFGIAQDITKRKATEDALGQAVEDLKRSNQDLEQFAYVASHDLQEPLRMISGFLRLLEERYKPQLDAKAGEYINYAVDGAMRMSGLITDLMAYSRVERKGKPPEPTDAGKALLAALANLRGAIHDAGATVTHDALPTVTADSTQLMQLLQNLVGNAVKFRSKDRPCQVHVGAKLHDGHWLFSVRDNGIGIPQGSFERMFIIFQRLHTRDKYAGTGIGLAICKKIVERHGGKIWIESTVGAGSTFFFTIPTGAGRQG